MLPGFWVCVPTLLGFVSLKDNGSERRRISRCRRRAGVLMMASRATAAAAALDVSFQVANAIRTRITPEGMATRRAAGQPPEQQIRNKRLFRKCKTVGAPFLSLPPADSTIHLFAFEIFGRQCGAHPLRRLYPYKCQVTSSRRALRLVNNC